MTNILETGGVLSLLFFENTIQWVKETEDTTNLGIKYENI